MLISLKEYCAKWRMFVNVAKTKIMVFNKVCHNTPSFEFKYDNQLIEVVEEFKYLGVVFSTDHNYECSISYRLVQGKRLVAAWMRRCKTWMFPAHMVVNQFFTCIVPALEYGIGLWGIGRWGKCKGIWEKVETFWRQIARQILKMPIRAPYTGIQGELEWYPFWTRAGWQATAFLTRVTKMNNNELTRKAMHVQRSLLQNESNCWLKSFRSMICSINVGKEYWNTWWNTVNFSCDCIRVIVSNNNPNKVRERIKWEDDVLKNLQNKAMTEWMVDLHRIEAKSGVGLNKLRTYALFKNDWGREPYLHIIENYKCTLLTRFRIGICPLRIETGRYEGGNKRIPVEQRVCLCCNSNQVENEVHFLIECTCYSSLRSTFFKSIMSEMTHLGQYYINARNSNARELFVYIMKSTNKYIIQALADFLYEAFEVRSNILSQIR